MAESVMKEAKEPEHGFSFLEALKNFVMGKGAHKPGMGNLGKSKAKTEAEKELERQYAMDEGKEPRDEE
jgi:hypothetical protein